MTTTELTQCDKCGRYGWHTTDRCPDLADTRQDDGMRVLFGELRGVDSSKPANNPTENS